MQCATSVQNCHYKNKTYRQSVVLGIALFLRMKTENKRINLWVCVCVCGGKTPKNKFIREDNSYLHRSGPAAASSLCVCQSGTWRHAQHGTGRRGSARQGTSSSSATDTDKVQTPSALSALFPGAYRLGTHTCEKGKKKNNIQLEHDTYGAQTHTLVLHVHTLLMY